MNKLYLFPIFLLNPENIFHNRLFNRHLACSIQCFLLAFIPFQPLLAQQVTDNQKFLEGLPAVKASVVTTPPDWAVMQRHLMRTMEEAAPYFMERFTRRGGTVYGEGPYDDVYEMFYNWPEFYAIGADESLYDMALQSYNAITRTNTAYYRDSIRYQRRLHKEFPRHDDFFHISEGMTLFYNLGLGDPTIPENRYRAQRFAGFYLNEDPEAQNFDPEHTLIKSIFTGSEGPLESSDAGYNLRYGHASLYPVVEDLEPDWHEHPERKAEIQEMYDEIITRTDVPVNLGTTGMVTNAYLYTGDEKYKQWVLNYVDAWMQRIEENDGLLPDNIGRTGKVGEYRNGQWWGGLYGWYGRYGLMMMFASLSAASENAYMLSGDPKYLDLLRSQIDGLMQRSKITQEGQMLVPFRYNKDGWHSYRPMMVRDLAHLWHASMAAEDWEKIEVLMEKNKYRPLSDEGIWGQNTLGHLDNKTWEPSEPFDWTEEVSMGDRSLGKSEHPRLMYYAGKNPDWPLEALKADYQEVMRRMHFMHNDTRSIYDIQGDDLHPNNPVITKALVQTTMGTPQSIYFGGLLRARLRYFDANRQRPGLPQDVAALVETLEAERTVVHLVNLSVTESRKLIVQAGAFGEHRFTSLSYQQAGEEEGSQAATGNTVVNGKYFMVELPPATSIRLDIGTERFVNPPAYAFPWHGGKVPSK